MKLEPPHRGQGILTLWGGCPLFQPLTSRRTKHKTQEVMAAEPWRLGHRSAPRPPTTEHPARPGPPHAGRHRWGSTAGAQPCSAGCAGDPDHTQDKGASPEHQASGLHSLPLPLLWAGRSGPDSPCCLGAPLGPGTLCLHRAPVLPWASALRGRHRPESPLVTTPDSRRSVPREARALRLQRRGTLTAALHCLVGAVTAAALPSPGSSPGGSPRAGWRREVRKGGWRGPSHRPHREVSPREALAHRQPCCLAAGSARTPATPHTSPWSMRLC